ncbi:hypothetical protein HDV06_007110 [Boothiomyces sp. JEL0866]|nr:hypothetical protein HDV06_007110 [Boothiomyces sp. JEL0866]
MRIKPIYMWPNLWINLKEDEAVNLLKQLSLNSIFDNLALRIKTIFKPRNMLKNFNRKPVLVDLAGIEWVFCRLDINPACFKLLSKYLPNAKEIGLSIKDRDDTLGLEEALKVDKVTSIYINNNSPLFLCNIQSMKKLRNLGVIDLHLNHAELLAGYLPLSNISELSITCDEDYSCLQPLFLAIPSSKVKKLNIFNSEMLNDTLLALSSVLQNSLLETLTLVNHPSVQKEISVEGITMLCKGMANSKVKSFCFRGYKSNLQILFNLLNKSNLECLICNLPTQEELQALICSLRHSKLKKLSTGIPAELMLDFLKESTLSMLEDLELRYIGWITNGDEICSIISQNIEKVKLKRLSINHAEITIAGLEMLISKLAETNLEYLDLSCNRIGEEAIPILKQFNPLNKVKIVL